MGAPSRGLAAAAMAVVVFVLVLALSPARSPVDFGVRVLVAGADAAPVLIASRRPMPAWGLFVVALALSPLVYHWTRHDSRGWLPGAIVAGLFVLYVVAEHRALTVVAGVYGATVGATVLAWLFSVEVTDPLLADWRNPLLIVVVPAVALGLGYAARWRREAEHAVARAAVVEERSRIARELHDVVAHHMSVLALRADSARYRFPDLSADLRDEFAALRATAAEGMTEMRRLLGVLREDHDGGAETTPQPGLEVVEDLVTRLREAGTDVSLRLNGDHRALPAGVSLSAYRIAQEALTNATRHAPGAAIEVEVDARRNGVRVLVRDSGGQATPGGRPGHGLIGMRERTAALGGTLEAGPVPGGFQVEAVLPVEKTGARDVAGNPA